jgi:pSer/pThr/pTyr-binding forkhead associated (FHA) protein
LARRSNLFALAVRRPDRPVEVMPLTRYPFTIGRAADNGIRLDAPGVWDRHLTLELHRREGLVAVPAEGAITRLGDELVEGRRRLRNGDELVIGPTQIQVLLAPPRRRSLRVWDVILWSTLAVLAAGQAILARIAFLDP